MQKSETVRALFRANPTRYTDADSPPFCIAGFCCRDGSHMMVVESYPASWVCQANKPESLAGKWFAAVELRPDLFYLVSRDGLVECEFDKSHSMATKEEAVEALAKYNFING